MLTAGDAEELPEEAVVSYENALDDYLTALDLDDQTVEVYLKAAEVYLAWKTAYIEYINEQERDRQDDVSSDGYYRPIIVYKLVDVNGDRIPELYIDFGDKADGSRLCTYYDGSVNDLDMWWLGFSYIEGGNLFIDSGGQKSSYDSIYSIVNGEFVVQAYDGSDMYYVDEDFTQVERDYYWNGSPVSSEEEYIKLLDSAYNWQESISPYDNTTYDSNVDRYVGNGLCDREEIIEIMSVRNTSKDGTAMNLHFALTFLILLHQFVIRSSGFSLKSFSENIIGVLQI